MSKILCAYEGDDVGHDACVAPATLVLVAVSYDQRAIIHFGCAAQHTELARDEMGAMPDGVTEYRLEQVAYSESFTDLVITDAEGKLVTAYDYSNFEPITEVDPTYEAAYADLGGRP